MRVILLRYGELFLKGGNRGLFEKLLLENIRKVVVSFGAHVYAVQGRYIVDNIKSDYETDIVNALTKIFGLVSLSVAEQVKTSKEEILEAVQKLVLDENKTFRATVKRAYKGFEPNSTEFSKVVGDCVIEKYPNIKVDLYNPLQEVYVDIRTSEFSYVYQGVIKCAGGLPYGSAGRGLLLLSGGIDSPVAGYMMAKRGLQIECLHFHSYPYTSEQARDKVLELAKKLASYTGGVIRLHMVSFTQVQEEIHRACDNNFMITIMRRIMMRVAERICDKDGLGAIITGESLGQVASQTMQSITVTNNVLKVVPVFRPLIGFDKEDIIAIANKIDTFNTSILPYEDCCTVFLPKNPVIKPKIKYTIRQENRLNLDNLIENALASEEIFEVKGE